MPQESALVVDLDPGDDASRPPSPSPSSSQQQLSPEALRELVLACGREAAEDGHQQASTSTRNRLRGQLGFCFYPMPWAAAVEAVADGGVAEMGKMGRTPEGVARYWAWRDEFCDKEYATTADYVRIEIMGCEEAEAAGGGRKVAGAPPADAASRVIWRENDFPYNFEPGIEHFNVWAFSALAPPDLERVIEERRPKADFDTLWYVNPAALASIPDVWHAHVLSRRRRRIKEDEG